MVNIELGVFAGLVLASLAPIFFAKWLGMAIILLISIVIMIGIALMMFAGYDVVMTKTISQNTVTTTTTTVTRNSTSGAALTNSSQTESVTVPQHNEYDNVINSQQDTIGWVFSLFALILSIIIIWKFIHG